MTPHFDGNEYLSNAATGILDVMLHARQPAKSTRAAPVLPDTEGTLFFTPDNMNQYTDVGTDVVTWHARGNLASDGTFDYSHDYLNRLRSVGSPTLGANYAYDSFNRRTSKVVNDVTTTFFYDQDRCVIEYNGAGAVERKFIYGPGPFSLILANRLSWKPAAKSTTITTTPSARW